PAAAALDHLARAREIEGDEPAGVALGAVNGLLVGREADAVVARAAERELVGPRSVGLGVVDAAEVARAPAGAAEIGEPEAAFGVEDDVVGRRQRMVA